MRSRVLVVVALAACGDDGSISTDGGGGSADANIIPPTIAVTFESIPTAGAFPVSDHVRGPGGRIYGLRVGTIVSSSDGGASYTASTTSTSRLAATSSALFGLNSGANPTLVRSTDGTTFPTIAVPAYSTFMAATPTTLWVATYNGGVDPQHLYRSTNQGDQFTEVALPATPNNRWTLTTGGEYLFIESQGHLYRTQTGATWDDLGTLAMLQSFAATQAGTALAYNLAGSYVLNRRTVADSAWVPATGTNNVMTISQRENGELVRINKYSGAIDLSTSDGASWTTGPAASLVECLVLEHHAFDAAILGTCYDTADTIGIRLPAAAAQWIREEPDGLPFPQVARYTDVSFSDGGHIALASKRKLYLSNDGTTWRRGTYSPDSTWPIDAVALSPNGMRMFVGSTLGRSAFLDVDGTPFIGPGSLPVDATEHVRQADWLSDDLVIVTTANPEDTKGTMLRGDPDGVSIWAPMNPYALESNPQFDPTVGFHGVEACPFNGSHTIVVGGRRWFGTNSYQTELRIKYQFGSFDPYMDVEPPVSPFIPSSLSCAPNGTQSLTFGDEFLYVGSFLGPVFRRVESTNLFGKLLVAKFAPDNRLWVITESGVFRSTAPIDAH